VHAQPADPADLPAGVRARRDARLLGGGDGAGGRRDAGAEADRERTGPRGRLPLPDHRRAGGLPGHRRPVPPAPDRRGRARRALRAREGGRVCGRGEAAA
jgi:hypothetical protein